MRYLSEQIQGFLGGSSMIRKMFEAGIKLKQQYGEDKVYDFSLGNPDLPPPPEVKKALEKITAESDKPFSMGYMPNAGFTFLRDKIAVKVSGEQKTAVPGSNVIVCCGAAGALNVFFRAVLTPGDEVLCPAPYFVEYGFYCSNYGGILKPVKTQPLTFALDVPAMAAAMTAKTRAIILNSPNNPTGRIYTAEELNELAAAVAEAEKRFGNPIYIISDEPYRFLNFDQVEIPSFFRTFKHSVVMGSCSKNLSLAGERLGYIAVSPEIEGQADLVAGLILCNRILGFVNSPVVGQKIFAECINAQVDLNVYRERRDAMAAVLDNAGIQYTMPKGAFYFFPKAPIEDDKLFIQALCEKQILAVPGSGFGGPGYFRLAFCVDKKVIENAGPGFKQVMEQFK